MERRRNKRYEVDGPVQFNWSDSFGVRQKSTGRVRNFCATGLFIESHKPPPLTTDISIRFELNVEGKMAGVCVKTKGRVNRVEHGAPEQWSGFSVYTGTMKLQKLVRPLIVLPD